MDTDRLHTVSQRVLSSCIWTLTQDESSWLFSISSLAERFRAWTLTVLFPNSFWKTCRGKQEAVEEETKIRGETLIDPVYLVVVDEVEDQVDVSVHGLVLGQLGLHPVQPVNESLESVCKLSGEQQGFLQLILSAGDHES